MTLTFACDSYILGTGRICLKVNFIIGFQIGSLLMHLRLDYGGLGLVW